MTLKSTHTAMLRRLLQTRGLPVIIDPADEPEPEPDAPEYIIPETFRVHNEKTANWVVRKIIDCRNRYLRAESWAAAEMKAAQRDEQFFLTRFGDQLQHWATGQIEKLGGRRKSLNLPAGTVGFRYESSCLTVINDQVLLAWCREHLPDALKLCVEVTGAHSLELREWHRSHCPDAGLSEAVAKSVVNDHFHQTGELPSGVEQVAGDQKFFVK